MNNRSLIPLLALGVCLASPAFARFDRPAERTTYELRGEDTERGPYTSYITVDPRPGGEGMVGVTRVVHYDARPDDPDTQRGQAVPKSDRLFVKLSPVNGLTGALEGRRGDKVLLTLRIDGQEIDARSRSRFGNGRALGRPGGDAPATPAADASDASPGLLGRFVQKGKHLLAVAEDKAREEVRERRNELIYDGVSLDETFKFSRFLHVGVGGDVRALEDTDLTPYQAFTSRDQPDHVWLVNTIHGGVRVPLTTTIPVAEVSVGVGLDTSARVDYEVTDLYPIPEGLNRDGLATAVADLKRMATRSFDLPLTADEAADMTIGAKRVFDGRGTIAISGSLGIGYDVGEISDVIKIGASARVGGFYRVQGDLRITVERLLADEVRVRVRRGDTSTRGKTANVFLGATVNETRLREELAPVTEYIDEGVLKLSSLPEGLRRRLADEANDAVVGAAADQIRKVLRFTLGASASESLRDEIDISHRFDLTKPLAREAYERAVRGDFTRAAALSFEPGSGVSQEFRVLGVEEHTHMGVNIKLSVLFEASASRDIRVSNLDIVDDEGTRNYEIFRFNRNRRLSFIRDRHKRMSYEVIRREQEGEVESSLRITLDILDPDTFSWQGNRVKRLLDSWGLDGEGSIPVGRRRFGRTRYGETRFLLRAEISDRGLRTAVAISDAGLLDAYIRGFTTVEGRRPKWATPEGRWDLENDHSENNNETAAKNQLKDARRFVRNVRQLSLARNAEERANALKNLAKGAKFNHYVLAAFMNIVPRETVSIDTSFMGDRIRIVDGRASGETLVRVNDPRRRQ